MFSLPCHLGGFRRCCSPPRFRKLEIWSQLLKMRCSKKQDLPTATSPSFPSPHPQGGAAGCSLRSSVYLISLLVKATLQMKEKHHLISLTLSHILIQLNTVFNLQGVQLAKP